MKKYFPKETDHHIKIFNETDNIGEIHFFNKKGQHIGFKHFTIKENKEEIIDFPKEKEKGKCFIPLLDLTNSKNFSDYLIKNEEKINTNTLEGMKTIKISTNQVIQKEQMPVSMYKSVDPTIEFGIARFIADQVNQLPKLLEDADIIKTFGAPGNYKIYALKKLSKYRKLSFNYRFIASTNKEARKSANKIKQKLTGVALKIWLACWEIGNSKKKLSFTVDLTEIMKKCHPERKSYFSEKEKEEFYEEIKRLKIPEFVFEETIRKKNRKKEEVLTYNIPMLFIPAEKGMAGKIPTTIQVNLFNIQTSAPPRKNTYYAGAPIKKTTLSLNAKDTSLASWLQIRIAQLRGGEKNINSHSFHREDLIKVSNLTTTDKSNPWKANTLLIKKLQRCKNAGIIKNYPEKIKEIVVLHF